MPDRGPHRVGVVVSHHDRRELLPAALESIAAQTYRDFAVTVVGDAGPDAHDIVALFRRRHADTPSACPLRYVHRATRGGVAATRNTGAAGAGGELVAYLDDDDLWQPRHLAGLVALLDAHPAAGVAYGDADVERMEPHPGEPGAWRVRGRLRLAVPFDLGDLRRDDFIVPGGMVHRRALFGQVGMFDESLHVSDDWDWLLRVARARGPGAFVRLAEPVVTVRIYGEGVNLSAGRGEQRRAALAEIERRHGTPPLEPKTFWEVAELYAGRG